MGLTRPKLAQVTTTTAAFNDAVIVLNNNASSGDNNTKDIGIVFERGADTNQVLLWDESQDRFILASSTEQGATQGDVTISGYADLQVNNLIAEGTITMKGNVTLGDSATDTVSLTADVSSNIIPSANNTYSLGDSSNNWSNVYTNTLTLNGTAVTATATELNYTDGVTSNIQTQLNAKAATASPTFTGTVNIPTLNINSAYTLPTVDGNAGYVLTTNGSGTVTWEVGGGEASGHEIQNNSVALTTRTALNFDGTYLVATDDAVNDQNDVTVSSALQTWHSTTNNSSNWDTAYGWGNHASQGYITNLAGLSITATATELNYVDGVTSNIQTQLDGKQASGSYLTGNQTITLSGDASGSGTTAITVTVADDSHNHSSSSGAFTVGGDLTVSGGDIVLSGTGRIQGIDTVSAGTDAASKTYVDNAVAGVVNSAPAALDTLNELAAALGDDANFSTTVTTSIGEKLAKASNLSDLTNAATARTNLGLGSAATAASTDFVSATGSDTMSGNLTVDNGTSTLIDVVCDDGGTAGIKLHGASQGTGYVEVGQSTTYGGGMYYNGDGSPAFASGETADTIGFYNLNAGTRTEVFSYPYNSNTVTFNGQINASGGNSSNWNTAYGWGNHASAGYLTGNQTITLSGDVSGSGTTSISCTVADDSHNHSNYITSNANDTGTGGYSTSGTYWEIGDGTGGVAMTTNDGYGNANLTFNHRSGVPDITGNCGRIEVNVDGTSDANMSIELGTNKTSGTATGLTSAARFSDTDQILYYAGSTKLQTSSSGVTITGVMDGTATSARYADLAEKYMPDAEYTAGTVLQFGGEQEVTLADEYATRRVAGVVSTNPGFMMNESLDGGVYIALTGRVPCRVTGIVNPGDLIVASNTPGVATAWNDPLRDPPAGSIIGKAIKGKALASEDIIEVVVGVR